MKNSIILTVSTLLLAVANLSAATRYVSLESTNPSPPYATWATAATNIQDAVDAAVAGEEIVVTNGTYATGGRGANRVAVDKALTVRSVNGPGATTIDGLGAVRCVYLANNAAFVGFTLTNGLAWGNRLVGGYGGGVYCESTNGFLTNCVIVGNFSSGYWAGASGGGVYGGTLYKCTLSGNRVWVDEGDGAGGGAYGSTLYNCTLTDNDASGMYPGAGGGACWSTLYGCTLTGNSASSGGGAYSSMLHNCTLTGNSAWYGDGGGAYDSTLYNCIVYFNTAPLDANYDASCTLTYCCTKPLAPGTGNISDDPRLTDSTHLSSDSPCVGAGSSNYTRGTDIDGEAWANPPSIGCDEFRAGAVTGPLTVSIGVDYTNAAAGFVLNFTAQISGRALVNFWDFDDGAFVINEPWCLSHSFATPGDYTVTLWAYNDSHPEGVSASVLIHVDNGLHYVSAFNQNPVAPYTSWATAATQIQDAVDAAGVGGTILVTNGAYASGGRAAPDSTTNRVVLDKPVTLRSVNGAPFTIIDGNHAMRCAYLARGAGISGFTMTNGTANYGGGAWGESADVVVSNCVITGNSASGGGGGAYRSTLYNCTLSGNSAGGGGGAYDSTLYNCTLTGNSAGGGGGASGCTLCNCTLTGNSAPPGGYGGGGVASCALYNCIVYYNTSVQGTNYDSYSTLNYCCTTPLPTNGVGNLTDVPLFVNYAGGNLRLQTNSPCINAGNNAYVLPSH